MTTTFKEGTNGFYCAECHMSFAEPLEICPYCGSIVSNYEELLTSSIVNKFITDITSSPPPDEIMKYRGLRQTAGILEDNPMIDEKELKEILKKWQENKNENNIY